MSDMAFAVADKDKSFTRRLFNGTTDRFNMLHLILMPLTLAILVSLAVTLPLRAETNNQIEPNAGKWQTWVISSGKDNRVSPPPGPAETSNRIKVA